MKFTDYLNGISIKETSTISKIKNFIGKKFLSKDKRTRIYFHDIISPEISKIVKEYIKTNKIYEFTSKDIIQFTGIQKEGTSFDLTDLSFYIDFKCTDSIDAGRSGDAMKKRINNYIKKMFEDKIKVYLESEGVWYTITLRDIKYNRKPDYTEIEVEINMRGLKSVNNVNNLFDGE